MNNYTIMNEINEKNNLQLVLSLKILKKDGTLDSEEFLESQNNKWRNSIDYKSLKNWLTCNNEELRLHALELITISKKSTLYFTEQELNLIIIFLKYNLREKLEYVPLIKKILKRLNDSYAVIKRHLDREKKVKKIMQKTHPDCFVSHEDLSNTHPIRQFYLDFLISLHKICLSNIYAGAVNIRKKSSLQILCLMDEFLNKDLKNSLWNLDHFANLVDCLLLDTYEVNKDLAFRLIKSFKYLDLYFNIKEKVIEFVNVALQMANSIRPLDSITAAYMLKICMLLPNIQEILLEILEIKEFEGLKEKTSFYMILLLKINLEKPVKLAIENIIIAASKHSLYGYIFCIHSILSTVDFRVIIKDECWRNILSDLVNMCFELNIAVSQIVNNSSPEGHLPMDLNPRHLDNFTQNIEEITITPQMVLLCSWRTVKEISLLFGYITSNASIFNKKTNIGLLTEDQIKEIGNQLVTLLCETKHRGAFEQAHVGFGQLCIRLWHLDEEQISLRQQPRCWLQQILLAIIGFTNDNLKLCATRRSAGIPFMVQSLVTSEIKKRIDPKTLIFHSVMRILLKLVNIKSDFNFDDAENLLFNETLFYDYEKSHHNNFRNSNKKINEITEIKTHALNILRALFRHCQLGDLVKDYIAEGFIVAFKSYDGQSWAERNAATLLFSALVIRVFGVQRTKDHVNLTLHNKMTGRIFFERFPSLLRILLNELTIFTNDSKNDIKPKIQSILLLISRIYPSVSSEAADKEWKIDEFINLVSKCGKSKVYKTRELAARALIPLLTEKNILPILSYLLNVIVMNELSFNLLHGYALQLLELIRSQHFSKIQPPCDQFRQFFTFINEKILFNLENKNNNLACFPISTTVMEIFSELSKLTSYSWIYRDLKFSSILEKIQLHLTTVNILKKRPGIELYEAKAINLIIATLDNDNYMGSLANNEYKAAEFWKNVLKHINTEVLSITWSQLIDIIKKNSSPILYDLGFMIAVKFLEQPVGDPNLQDAIFYFLYCATSELNKNFEYIQYTFPREEEKCYMCIHILHKLIQLLKLKTFYLRGEFFKLFGKVYGFILKNNKEISKESKMIIYETFCTYGNMESDLDCRISISEVLFDLYVDTEKENDLYFALYWWTTLLQLLYDDNFKVRSNAAEIVRNLTSENEFHCEAIVTETFFNKFALLFQQHIEAEAAAFFTWSMTSAAVVLEEMDETDVFNKSYNYECFEPLQITYYCVQYLKNISFKHNLKSITLSKSIKEWLQKQLHVEETCKFNTLHEFIINYINFIPNTEKSLNRILDPTYPAKMIKEIAYLDIRNSINVKNNLDENGLVSANKTTYC